MSKLRKKKINIFMRWGLKVKGWSDARNKIPRMSIIDGYYYTPYIGEIISKFISIAEDEFSKIRDKLTELNETIENLNHTGEAIIKKACADISDKKLKISKNNEEPDSPKTKAINDALSNDINEIERLAIDAIDNNNSKGKKAQHESKKLISNFNICFNEGLNNCLEKLEIYWGSLYIKNIKMNTEIEINAQMPNGDELLKMCNKTNPINSFIPNEYIVLSFDDIEMAKHK